MRLTLRTMLAYLDEVLDPADSEALGKKINESEFASHLVQRIKTVSKKVRMDAPKLDGKGMGNDANTVSEYLDSTLPQDRVGDFERICLESDRHLAEAAACHQVLTLVLGKPADVPQELRDKIYALGHPESAPAKTKKSASPPVSTAANGKPAAAQATEVPDYLRAGQRSNILPFLATLAAAFLIGAVILRAMGPFDGTHPLVRWMNGSTTVAQAVPNSKQLRRQVPFRLPAGQTSRLNRATQAPMPSLPSNRRPCRSSLLQKPSCPWSRPRRLQSLTFPSQPRPLPCRKRRLPRRRRCHRRSSLRQSPARRWTSAALTPTNKSWLRSIPKMVCGISRLREACCRPARGCSCCQPIARK
jgi:hypothetical protein